LFDSGGKLHIVRIMQSINYHKKEEIDKLPVDTTGAFFATVYYGGRGDEEMEIYLYTYNDHAAPQNSFYKTKSGGKWKRGVKEF